MSNNEQESLEFELAQALFTTGTSFSFLENPYVIKFFQHIHPTFKLPNRKKLSNELLNKVYDKVTIESNIQISQAQSLSMISDAINIEKFSAVIIDTANVMKAAWHIIEEKYLTIACFGCASHTLNLLIKDILKINSIKTVVDNATKLVKYFKKYLQAMGTHLECFQSFQKTRIALEQILIDLRIHETIDSSLRIYILYDEFWENLNLIAKESKIYNIEPIRYNAFTTYTNQKFGQEKSVELFIKIWESWPNSSLKQLAIKILTIPTSSAVAERNFSTFGFIHNKLHNHLIETIINHNNETNQKITSNCEEIDNEDKEVENMIYEEEISEGIEEMIKQIYSSDIDIDNNNSLILNLDNNDNILWNQDTEINSIIIL
ncbi:3554_t:CDS:2 [Scutellospora calospora]|uniref:3554_t:CDS:1 n=1 Tax=Scutellospora calospora TaxID=85575 RepID=A0ACA9KTB0_9GLOM|nr:3554_t:CDS:2 [Scutellospora calospora]